MKSLLAIAALSSCGCPTLWIQVTKTDPAPWPEVMTPEARAPITPVAMQNRTDVFHAGAVVREAPAYRDALDPSDVGSMQSARALNDLQILLSARGDKPVYSCKTTVKATPRCYAEHGANGENHGRARNCTSIILPPDAPPASVIATPTRQVLYAVDPRPVKTGTMYHLSGRMDIESSDPLDVCIADFALSTPLLSFVHTSDIQIRDPSVWLTDRRLSAHLDWFKPLDSFEYDPDMAFYNQYLVEAMISTVNAAANEAVDDKLKPSFVIHTGDSVDANMMSELKRFHQLIDRLDIPFFELFGNHDMLVFGNLTPTDRVAQADDAKCTSVAALLGHPTSLAPDKICVDAHVKRCPTCTWDETRMIASEHGHEATKKTFIDTLAHDVDAPVANLSGTPSSYCSVYPRVLTNAYSRNHGFDLGTRDDTPAGERLGYYAFARPISDEPKRNAVFIALDSEEFPDHNGGIGGHIGSEQYKWVKRVLECVAANHKQDIVFAFAHQPLSMLDVTGGPPNAMEQLFADHKQNFIAYLFGHNHEHSICGDRRTDAHGRVTTCANFWEIETGSLVEFPQEMRMVRLKQVGIHTGFMELSTFSEQLVDPNTQIANYIALARAGAMRDHCVTHGAHCSADKRPYREDGDSTAARLFFALP